VGVSFTPHIGDKASGLSHNAVVEKTWTTIEMGGGKEEIAYIWGKGYIDAYICGSVNKSKCMFSPIYDGFPQILTSYPQD
jgi:hypothetical protein